MQYNKTISGKYIDLDAVQENDASFIIDIRSNEEKTKFLHQIDKDEEKQKKWIRKQISALNDFYFVYKDKKGNKIGLASVYNIDESKKEAEFGRWISNGNVFENLEAVILLFDFAFANFDIDSIYLRMVVGNDYVSNFWKSFGADHFGLVHEEDFDFDKWIVTKEKYFSIRNKHTKLLRY